MAKTTKTATRTRNWTFIHYPCPTVDLEFADALEVEEQILIDSLIDRGIPCALQRHDKDTTEKGKPKPLHWHIVVSYSSVKSLEQVREDFEGVAANGFVEPVRDMRAAIRYLAHMDNPEKAQYDTPKTLNGLDISKHITTSDKQKEALKAMKELIRFVNDNAIYYYNDLLDLLDAEGRDDLYRAAINRRLITPLLAYLKAKDTKLTRQRADLVP